MKSVLQVLSEAECAQVHERSLKILAKTGVRVDSERGRRILSQAGAVVDEKNRNVSFPPSLIEEVLPITPKTFTLGSRKDGWDLQMNEGNCVLAPAGSAILVMDSSQNARRKGEFSDWLAATQLIDSIDEFGLYWRMVEGGSKGDSLGDFVEYWHHLILNCSKHIQEPTKNSDETKLLLEILQVVFGDKENIRRKHPISFNLCPHSPLVIEDAPTDAYLETIGWDIPLAIMPMPLMGMTSPASLISTILLGNCETLAMLCLVQAASPGTPVIYAPVLSVIEPRSGRYSGGGIEHSFLGAAVTVMARYYDLPVEACSGGSDHHIPDIQSSYERALNWVLPTLAWPDILVGPGLLSGSTVFSAEQLLIDIEVFKRCKQINQGIRTSERKWLDEVIEIVGPNGNFLTHRSTREALKDNEWYLSGLGVWGSFESWEAADRPGILEEARSKVAHILKNYQPLALDRSIENELNAIEKRVRHVE